MKSLGALACLTLLVVPLVGTSTPANDDFRSNPFILDSLRMNEEITGDHVDVDQLELLASSAVSVPVDAMGVQAHYDGATDVLSIVPTTAMPDTSGESGCILANTFGGFGYTKSPASCGTYAGFEHPGSVETLTLVCVSSQYCNVTAYGYDFVGGFNYRYLTLYCQFNTVTIGQVSGDGAGSSIGNGLCAVFGFSTGGEPAGHLGYVSSNGPTAGLVNW